jgi:hypothetical protein
MSSDVTMQYNDCATWNMDALLRAAEIVEELDEAQVSAMPCLAKLKVCLTAAISASAAPTAQSGSGNSSSNSGSDGSDTGGCSLATMGDKLPKVSLSMQAQRPILPNTKYLQHMRALEQSGALAVCDTSSRSPITTDSDATDTHRDDSEDAQVLRMLGE